MNLQANAVIDLTAAILLLLLYADIKHDHNKSFKQELFKWLILVALSVLVSDTISWHLDGRVYHGSHITGMFINTFLFIMQTVYSFLWLIYTDYWIHGSIKRIKKKKWLYAVPLITETVIIFLIYSADVYLLLTNRICT